MLWYIETSIYILIHIIRSLFRKTAVYRRKWAIRTTAWRTTNAARQNHLQEFPQLQIPECWETMQWCWAKTKVGKTNLRFALRLILDPSLPDSMRRLRLDYFWTDCPVL